MSSATASPTAYIPSCFNNAREFYKSAENKHLVAAYRSMLCNTCILAERIFRGFPPQLAYLSRTCLSYTGVLGLYEFSQVQSLFKSAKDCKIFYQNRNLLGMALTAVKVYYKSIDIFLILGGAVVSVGALAGFSHWINVFYLFMRPFTLTSLTLFASSRLTDHIINKKLVAKTMPNHDLWVGAQRESWEDGSFSLEAKATISRDEVIQFIVFQVLLTICAANPGTALSAALIWGNSIYLVRCAHRKVALKS